MPLIATRFTAHADASRAPTARVPNVFVIALYVALLIVGFVLLGGLGDRGTLWKVAAPPLHAHFEVALSARVLVPLTVGVLLVGGWRAARVLGWRQLLLVAMVAAAAWAVAVAYIDGADGLTHPVVKEHEYFRDVALVGSPGVFLDGFADDIDRYAVHVQGHPPGLLLGLWSLDRIGLGGAGWVAALFIAGGAAATPAALVTAREVAGERFARQAAPFLVLAPAAIWVASSADALYAGVGAWAIALVVLGTRRPRSDGPALAGGLLFGALCFLSYGLVLLAVIPLAVAWHRRRLRPVGVALLAAVPVFAAFAWAGFWWPDGLFATKEQYDAGIASQRPYLRFLVGNLAAFALVLGPATAVALSRLRDRRVWLLVGAALAAIAVANLSGMSKGEVERIWLPFAPWVLLAGGVLAAGSAAATSRWLGVQAGSALILATCVRIPW